MKRVVGSFMSVSGFIQLMGGSDNPTLSTIQREFGVSVAGIGDGVAKRYQKVITEFCAF